MASPDPERALEDETPAQPGARAGEPRGGDDEDFRKVAGEAGERAGRAAEGRLDPRGVGGRSAGKERLRGEAGAAHGGADALARDVTRGAGRAADRREGLAAEPPRLAAPDGVRVPAKGREGEVVGQPAAGAEARQQALEPPADGLAAERAHADVQEVALREVPAVALEVGLGDELGPAVAGRERAQALGADARLALLRHDHVLLGARPPERTRDRAAVPARADHDPGGERARVARDLDAARDLAHLAHARALVHPGARARASRHATVLPPGPPPTTRTSEGVIREAALPARRAGRRAARAGVRSRSQRAWPRRCRPRCRARRRCTPRRSGATWAGGRCAGTRRASGTRPRSRSRPSCPRRWSSRPRGGRRVEPRGRRRRAGGARPPPPRADPGAPRAYPPSSALAASREAPFKRP